ncbi:unnamed protein product [Trichobilharzia regenti]|nr:unnamed protein product [Trichobilharzia regenti]
MKRQHDVSDANIQPENDTFIKCLLELRESGKSVDRRSPHIRGSNDESVSVSASSAHYALPTVASDGSICQQGVLLIPKTEVKSRTPGHGVHMHEKLSARSKKRTANSIEEIEEKQDRARVLRQRHLLERTERVHELSKKVCMCVQIFMLHNFVNILVYNL